MQEIIDLGGFAYLATPYSKYKHGMEAAFIEAARISGMLIASGVAPFCPIAHSHPIAVHGKLDPLDHSIWLPADAPIMEAASCCVVALMDGWDESYGVSEEIKAFRAADKPIFTLNPFTGEIREFADAV